MNILKSAILCSIAVCSTYTAAAGYGVIDLVRVVDSSTYLKQQNAALNQSIKPMTTKMEQLGRDIENVRKQAQQANLSQADIQRLGTQYQAKLTEFDTAQKALQSKVQSGLQSMNNTFEGRLKQAAEQLRKENNLDYILNKNSVVAFDSKNDLTDKLIQKVNAAN